MLISYHRGQGSIVLRVKVLDSSATTGAGLTGLTSSSSGLRISTIADNEATATAYTVAGSTIETITTLGTYAAPTATKCRFKELDATNHKGVYEIHIADARFAVSSAKSLLVSILGATNAAETDAVIPLTDVDPYDATAFGMSRLDAAITTRLAPATAGRTLVVDASGLADSNAVKVGPTGSGTAQTARDLGASVLLSPGTGTGQVSLTSGTVTVGTNNDKTAYSLSASQTFNNTGTWTGNVTGSVGSVGGNVGGSVGSVTGAVGSVTGNVGGNVTGSVGSLASQAKVDVENAVWDASLAGNAHNANNTAGKLLKTAGAGVRVTILTGTAQAGSTANTIKLSAAASAISNVYNTALVSLTGGVGIGQTRSIVAYNGTTKVATVDKDWVVTPTNTTTFDIVASSGSPFADSGIAQAGSSSTITLATTASSVNSVYVDGIVTILSGTGSGQFADITGYVGSTRVVTIAGTWAVNPDNTSVYAVIPSGEASAPVYGGPSESQIAVAVRDVSNASPASGSLGAAVNTSASAGDPLASPVPGAYGAGTAGYILGTNLDAAITSRSTYAGSDTAGTATLLSRLTDTRAGYFDNLSAGPVALAEQVPADFTDATFVSPGVFAAEALVNVPGSGSGLDAAGVRAAVGLASANLDTQLATLSTFDPASDTVAHVTLSDTVTTVTGGVTDTLPGGIVVSGTSLSSVKLSGLPAGKNYVGQRLFNRTAAEYRVIESQGWSGGVYTLTLGSGTGEGGPFSDAPTTGMTIYMCP